MGRYVFKLPDVGEGTAEAEIVRMARGGRGSRRGGPAARRCHDRQGDRRDSRAGLRNGDLDPRRGGRDGRRRLRAGDLRCRGRRRGGGHGACCKAIRSGSPREQPALPRQRKPEPNRSRKRSALQRRSSQPCQGSAELTACSGGHAARFATRTPGEKPVASPAVRGALGARRRASVRPWVGARGTHHARRSRQLPRRRRGRPRGHARGAASAKHGIEEHKVIGIRRKIAERMQEAKRRIPHFSYVEEVDMTALEALRLHLNASMLGEALKLTLLPFFMRAIVRAVSAHPEINARFDDDNGVVHRHEARAYRHRDADAERPARAGRAPRRSARPVGLRGRSRASRRARRARARRRARSCRLDDHDHQPRRDRRHRATPIINYPEVAIVGVNKLAERPVVHGGQIVVRKMMNLSCSFDHRVVDGWNAAEFVQKLKGLLEQPATLFSSRKAARRRAAGSVFSLNSGARRPRRTETMAKTLTPKVLVVGAGPGGYVAAIRAGQLASTA